MVCLEKLLFLNHLALHMGQVLVTKSEKKYINFLSTFKNGGYILAVFVWKKKLLKFLTFLTF